MKTYSDFEINILTGKGTPCTSFKVPSYICRLLENYMLNDNVLVKTFLFPDKDGPDNGAVPNSLNVTISQSLPDNVRTFLSVLVKEHPLLRGCSSPEEAFEFIRSRYDQYGAEVDDYIGFLEEILDEKSSEPESNSSEQNSTE